MPNKSPPNTLNLSRALKARNLTNVVQYEQVQYIPIEYWQLLNCQYTKNQPYFDLKFKFKSNNGDCNGDSSDGIFYAAVTWYPKIQGRMPM